MKIFNVIEFEEPHNTDTYIGVYPYSTKEGAVRRMNDLIVKTKRDWFRVEDGQWYSSRLEWEENREGIYRCCNDRGDYYTVRIEEKVLNTR